jgi:hypothetical protein
LVSWPSGPPSPVSARHPRGPAQEPGDQLLVDRVTIITAGRLAVHDLGQVPDLLLGHHVGHRLAGGGHAVRLALRADVLYIGVQRCT